LRKLEAVCAKLGIPVRVSEVQHGPQVYRVRLEPAENRKGKLTRLTTIRRHAPDIGLAIGAHPVTATQDRDGFWLEIPRRARRTVRLTDFGPDDFSGGRLPILLGAGLAKRAVVVDLADPSTPHILIAGTTGSGKTVLLKGIAASLLRHGGEAWGLAVVDTKRDLTVLEESRRHICFRMKKWDATEHFRRWLRRESDGEKSVEEEGEEEYEIVSDGVITSPETANNVLDLVYQECERRQEQGASEPRFVLIVDEFADLVLSNQYIREKTVRVAQVGRSAGVHLVLATQRPSVQVVDGLIKANFPVRVAPNVLTQTDSRVVLDTVGAEKLLGAGDGLVLLGGELVRFQAPYVTDDEIAGLLGRDNGP
jgi:S-DNA-T family DNA segregation ATPase FtsK/SpoIIIE